MEWFLCLLEALYITTIAYPLTLDDMLFYIKGRICNFEEFLDK